MTEKSRFDFQQYQQVSVFSKASRPLAGLSFAGEVAGVREADHHSM
jgi:hypothetical protein